MVRWNILIKTRLAVEPIWSWKGYMLTVVATIAFANVVLVLFGNTIPNILLMIFGNTIPGVFQNMFRVVTGGVIVGAVFIFVMAWLLRAKPRHRPRAYKVMIFDVFGKVSIIDGLRVNFKNHGVAWSYMKQYKMWYPLHNFALISDSREGKPTIYRYI